MVISCAEISCLDISCIEISCFEISWLEISCVGPLRLGCVSLTLVVLTCGVPLHRWSRLQMPGPKPWWWGRFLLLGSLQLFDIHTYILVRRGGGEMKPLGLRYVTS